MDGEKAVAQEAIKVLKDGGIVIFPTDTAFGIGCRIDDEKAVGRLFDIRKRPYSKATPVLTYSLEMVQEYVKTVPPEVIEKLIKPHWPGALTIILLCRMEKVPRLVRGGGRTIGIRIPNHPMVLKIIKGVEAPVLGPSANFHGEKTPYRLEDLDKKLVKAVDYVVPGKCLLKSPSTVIDCSEKPWRVVREGAIKIKNSSVSRRIKIQNHLSSGDLPKGDNSKLKNNTTLLIDTSSSKEITVKLKVREKEYTIKRRIGVNKAQAVLQLIDDLLRKINLKIKEITKIRINVKHGSFTGVRVGLSIANALSFALKIPVKKL